MSDGRRAGFRASPSCRVDAAGGASRHHSRATRVFTQAPRTALQARVRRASRGATKNARCHGLPTNYHGQRAWRTQALSTAIIPTRAKERSTHGRRSEQAPPARRREAGWADGGGRKEVSREVTRSRAL